MIGELYNWVVSTGPDWFISQLQKNDFLVGFLSTAVLGGITYTARSLPKRIYGALRNAVTVTIMVNSELYYYPQVNEFLAENVIWTIFQRHFLFHFRPSTKHKLSAGYGGHFGNYKGTLVRVYREMLKDSVAETFKEQTTVTIYSRRRKVMNEFIGELSRYLIEYKQRDIVDIYTAGRYDWTVLTARPRRKWESLFVPEQLRAQIVNHLDGFVSSEEDFKRLGTPYHTGVFLSGIPGSGKTSLIHVIASYMKRDIYYLNLNIAHTDNALLELMSHIDCQTGILVIEDIDVGGLRVERSEPLEVIKGLKFNPDVEPKKPKKQKAAADDGTKRVTLSTVLNVLDGLLTPHGLIVVATSNNITRLDPALIRKGRFDLIIDMNEMQWPEFARMATAFGMKPEQIIDLEATYIPVPAVEARTQLLSMMGSLS